MAAGLHLTLTLPVGVDAAAVVTRARRRGLRVGDVAAYRIRSEPRTPQLVLGYGNLADNAVEEAAAQLTASIRD